MDAAQIYALLKDLTEAVVEYRDTEADGDIAALGCASTALERRWNHVADALARTAAVRTYGVGGGVVMTAGGGGLGRGEDVAAVTVGTPGTQR